MADDQQQVQNADAAQAAGAGVQFPPQFFECVNEHLELSDRHAQKYGGNESSLTSLFAASRFNAHVFLLNVKPINAAAERTAFLDHMTTLYRRMLNEHLDGMGEERGIDVGDSELADEYRAAGVKVGRLKTQVGTPAESYVAAAAAVPPTAANE